jgi:hypothetical protein
MPSLFDDETEEVEEEEAEVEEEDEEVAEAEEVQEKPAKKKGDKSQKKKGSPKKKTPKTSGKKRKTEDAAEAKTEEKPQVKRRRLKKLSAESPPDPEAEAEADATPVNEAEDSSSNGEAAEAAATNALVHGVAPDVMAEAKNTRSAVAMPPPSGKDFVITIPYPGAFKNMVEIMAHVLDVCQFSVVCSPKFAGMCVNSYDKANCCMIIGRFACDTKVRGMQNFCVKMPMFNALLKLVQPRLCLEISRTTGSATISMVAFDPTDKSQYQEFEIPTLDREEDEETLDSFKSDFTIEIELNEFRGLVKTAKDLKAEDLSFQILEEKNRGPLRSSYLVLSIDGDAKCRKVYHSLTDWTSDSTTADGDALVIKTAEHSAGDHQRLPAMNKLKICLDEKFSINYLTNFMASMKRPKLTMRLSSSGEPMVLCHTLGSESSVSFVLAPRAREAANGADEEASADK